MWSTEEGEEKRKRNGKREGSQEIPSPSSRRSVPLPLPPICNWEGRNLLPRRRRRGPQTGRAPLSFSFLSPSHTNADCHFFPLLRRHPQKNIYLLEILPPAYSSCQSRGILRACEIYFLPHFLSPPLLAITGLQLQQQQNMYVGSYGAEAWQVRAIATLSSSPSAKIDVDNNASLPLPPSYRPAAASAP